MLTVSQLTTMAAATPRYCPGTIAASHTMPSLLSSHAFPPASRWQGEIGPPPKAHLRVQGQLCGPGQVRQRHTARVGAFPVATSAGDTIHCGVWGGPWVLRAMCLAPGRTSASLAPKQGSSRRHGAGISPCRTHVLVGSTSFPQAPS